MKQSTNIILLKMAISFLSVLLHPRLMAQSDLDLNLETRSGYEYNVFNANPDKSVIMDGLNVMALQSGYFQNARISGSWELKSKHHMLHLSGKLEKDYFFQLKIADLYRPDGKIKYTLKLNKKHSFSLSGRRSSYRTNRPDDDSEVIRPPRSYQRSEVSAKYNMKLFSGNSFYIKTNLRKNVYSTSENREFHYNSMKSTASISQKIYNSKKQYHSFGVRAEYEVRLYFDAIYKDETEEENIKERRWQYYGLQGEYTWYVKSKFKMELGVNADERRDVLQGKYGFRQLQPYMKIAIKGSKVNFDMKGSFAKRKYTTLKTSSGSDVALVHDYIRGSMKLTWKMSKKIHLDLKSTVISRSRNFPEGARSFLAYDNAIASLGIKYKIF